MKTILEEDDDQPIVETSTGKSVKKLGHSISLEVTAPDSCSLTNNNEGGSHHYSADSRDSVVIRRSMFDMNIHLKDAGPPLISEWQAHLDSITSLGNTFITQFAFKTIAILPWLKIMTFFPLIFDGAWMCRPLFYL